jgi:hypothetical protein
MDPTALINLLTLIMAISLASERLVTFLKTLIPYLAGDPLSKPTDPRTTDRVRQLIVMVITFLAAWLTTFLIPMTNDPKSPIIHLPDWLLALLASGGSAFWNNILGYLKATKDINIQKNIQEKVNTQAKVAAAQ